MISDQEARDRVIHDHDTLFAVDAGAGTGKTTLLVSRLVALLLEKQAPLNRIAAITFTEKAAAELAERLRSKLEEELRPARLAPFPAEERRRRADLLGKALEDMERAPISTIHSFCAALLRDYPVEAGVDPHFTLLDEVQSGAFEAQAWEQWLKKSLSKPVEPLFHFLRLGGTFEQVETLKQFLKRNRTLLTVPAPRPLPPVDAFREKWKAFVAFTRKEAAQCAKQEDSLYKALEAFWTECETIESINKPESHPHPDLLPSREKGEKTSGDPVRPGDSDFELANLKIPKVGNKGAQGNWGKERLAAVRQEFVKLAEGHQAAFAPFKEAVLLNLVHWVSGYLGEWEARKAQSGFLDFDDLLLKARDLLRDHPEAREEVKDRLDYLFVDEFQDTDPLQVEIVFFLCEKKGKAEKDWRKVNLKPGKLFLVGDPKQSIYRFRRADVAIYEATKERIRANGGRVEVLTENFRTVGGLVEWVNGLFPALFDGTGIQYHPLNPSRQKGKTEGTLPVLWGLRIPEPVGEKPSKAAFRQLEAEQAADHLKNLLDGGFTVSDPRTHEKRPVRKGDIAVLFRDLSNENEEYWEEALRKRDLSYQIVGGKRFYNRPEIVALSALLTCLSSPADEAACAAVLRGPVFGFSDEELFLHRARGGGFRFLEEAGGRIGGAFQCLRRWFEATRTLGVSDTLAELYRSTNLLAVTAGQPHGEQRVANLMKVLDQARDLEASQHFTYRAFTQWLTAQQEEGTLEGEAPGPDSSEDRITLMTIHKAKGLEFPVVFVSAWAADPKDSGSLVDRKRSQGAFKAGATDLGLKSLYYDEVQEEEDRQRRSEDTRLLYVAATRARDCLLLPYFQMPPGSKFRNENLFAGPLLKALEENGVPMPAEARPQAETKGVPVPASLQTPVLAASRPQAETKGVPVPASLQTPVLAASRPQAETKGVPVPASLQTPVHWAETKQGAEPLDDPPAWVVPLDGKPGPALDAEKEKLEAQRKARLERLEGLRGRREFQSVTFVLSVDREKGDREERVFEEPEAASPWGGRDLGSLAHLLMEKGWDWDGETLKRAALVYGERAGVPPDQAEVAAQWAGQALSSGILQRARKSARAFRELPLTGKRDDGTYLNAVLDLAFLEDGEWVVVDYKTDRDVRKDLESYRRQVGYYVELLETFTRRKVKEAFLYFLRNGHLERVQ